MSLKSAVGPTALDSACPPLFYFDKKKIVRMRLYLLHIMIAKKHGANPPCLPGDRIKAQHEVFSFGNLVVTISCDQVFTAEMVDYDPDSKKWYIGFFNDPMLDGLLFPWEGFEKV